METVVYVDVLLAINYIINTLLLHCTAKMAGRAPKRRKIVAAALFGSVSSLTIFFPFMGAFPSILLKLAISALIVWIAFQYGSCARFLHIWLYFFAVNFAFAGIVLGVWLLFTPPGMLYYNGIVYFHISSVTLIITTGLAYLLLGIIERQRKKDRITGCLYLVEVSFRNVRLQLTGLMDTGNCLQEPISGSPVVVCGIHDILPLLPTELARQLLAGRYHAEVFFEYGIPVRFVPYQGVGQSGAMPAFCPDYLILERPGEWWRVERVYLGISPATVGDGHYNAILSPDLIGMKLVNGGVK